MTTATTIELFAASVDLPEASRAQMTKFLNGCLADTVEFYTHAKHAHWNVKGLQFASLHALFDEIAGHAQQQADVIAERIAALGGTALGTAEKVVSNTSLPSYDLAARTGEEHLRVLARQLAAFAFHVRAGIDVAEQLDDPATADLLTEVLREVQKDLWMLEAHLQSDAGDRHLASSSRTPLMAEGMY